MTLTQSAGTPGGTVAVPVQFAGVQSAPTGVITLKLRFAGSKLTFTKVELGGVAESVDAVATVTAQQRGDERVLDVTIATPEKDGTRAALPDGPLAQLLFTVAKDQKAQTVIPVKVEASVAGLAADAAAVKVPAPDGEVIVANPVVISCFFYMH
ncbi:MAG: cohesin domain-containing protein [Vicinamibacterales bacterium]